MKQELSREGFSFSAIFDGITNFFKSSDISDILEDTRNRLRDSAIPAVSIPRPRADRAGAGRCTSPRLPSRARRRGCSRPPAP